MLNKKCPFCSPEIERRTIYSNDFAKLILARDAINPGQALVVSKRHVEILSELNENELTSMYSLAKKVADIFTHALNYDGVNILMNSGISAGQTVHHSHIHIVPRITGDVPVAREWLNPALKKKEYNPEESELYFYSTLLKKALNKP